MSLERYCLFSGILGLENDLRFLFAIREVEQMQLRKWLEQWDLDNLKINAGFLEMEWIPRDEDKAAAWDLYIELLTRVTTQRLVPAQGTEWAALASIYQMFPITREIIRRNGRHCVNFTKIAIVVLNQIVRPFTTKWHGVVDAAQPLSQEQSIIFRVELLSLQSRLRKYTRLLADMAAVEDLTDLEADD